ncbi:MAG: ATP-dependent helicase, RecQ family [Deltaproteobacteria bacterium]|nr:ATP-dependent helicase, RecQ family [Deltaproteobacteria bacterium]
MGPNGTPVAGALEGSAAVTSVDGAPAGVPSEARPSADGSPRPHGARRRRGRGGRRHDGPRPDGPRREGAPEDATRNAEPRPEGAVLDDEQSAELRPHDGQQADPGRRRRRRRKRRGHGSGDRPQTVANSAVETAARRLGLQRLYPEQQRIISEVSAGRDVLVVLPTGYGKSACYQIPSMTLPKPVVLCSPLLALLQDQNEKLQKLDVPVVRLDGTIRGKARRLAFERLAAGGPILLMTTPETLGAPELLETLSRTGIGLAAIDEAHCISEWGHDFRPAYLRIGEHLRALGRPPIMALTATATEKVREDISRFLGLDNPVVVSSSPHRSNLAFQVLECVGDMRSRALIRFVRRLHRPGIVYCTTTREVDSVYLVMRQLDIPAHRYHGKMTAAERQHEQEMYMKSGRRTVMVATSAFGLGIDKPDIRYIIHYQAPASLEQYVQEAGRAGRDGRRSDCILLYDPSDREIHELLLGKSRVRPDQLYKIGEALAAWGGENRTPTLEALSMSAGIGPRIAQALLAILEEAELVRLTDGTIEVLRPDTIEEESRSLSGQFATLRTQDGRRLDSVAEYVHAPGCRAVTLRRYFGESNERPCGLCDSCRGVAKRPASFYEPVVRPPRRRRKERVGRRERGRGRGRGAKSVKPATPAPQALPPSEPATPPPAPIPTLPPPLPPPLDL